ncbi:MAG: D-amino acid dehydrogenase [Magnetovibrio sp.]|nr:D-amino acid dehydrogenase [Magnetovibrio sp.]
MKVVVLGAGVIGISTAYELACDGHDVIVVDRCEDVALETSNANGGQLSSDHGEPLAAPGVIRKAIKWLGKHDAPLLYRLRLDPQLWSWTLQFMSNCKDPLFWDNAAHILRLSLYSRQRIRDILARETIAFDRLSTGILTLYHNDKDFNVALNNVQSMKELGSVREILDRKGCIEHEPALEFSSAPISGGIFTPNDESGDCYLFTKALAECCRRRGVQFQFNTTVTTIERKDWRVKSVQTDKGPIEADVYVLALGSYSPLFVQELGLNLPIYPAKGYSVTVPVKDDTKAPKTSITSKDYKLVFSRLGNKLRVAGMLEFNGYDTNLDASRARVVLENALKLFPRAADRDHAEFWTGLRPQTPDSVPILGRARQENLVLNTGHGMLGWTMAMGSARIAADLAAHRAPEIDVDGFGWERFA